VLCSVGRLVEVIEVERSEPVELPGPHELVEGTAVFGRLWFGGPLPKIVTVGTLIDFEETGFVGFPRSETVEECGVHLSGLLPASLATSGLKLSPS
jgi:hypothetical protein